GGGWARGGGRPAGGSARKWPGRVAGWGWTQDRGGKGVPRRHWRTPWVRMGVHHLRSSTGCGCPAQALENSVSEDGGSSLAEFDRVRVSRTDTGGLMNRTARVIVASNRAAAGVYPDRTGPVITEWLAQRSFDVTEPLVVEDGEPVAQALRTCLAEGVDLVVTTGGTGISPTDRTPEATAEVLDFELPGLADAIRAEGQDTVPTAMLSRGLAGVAGRTLVVNLPGSRGGVRDGLSVLDRVLDHALDQIAGGDH